MQEAGNTTSTDLDAAAAAMIGQIILCLSRFEFNLNLCLRNMCSRTPELADPLISRLNFKSRIDALLDVVQVQFRGNDDCLAAFKGWGNRIHSVREKRNRFVHGTWTVQHFQSRIVNVSPGLVSQVRKETYYYIEELARELSETQAVVEEFYKLREAWHI